MQTQFRAKHISSSFRVDTYIKQPSASSKSLSNSFKNEARSFDTRLGRLPGVRRSWFGRLQEDRLHWALQTVHSSSQWATHLQIAGSRSSCHLPKYRLHWALQTVRKKSKWCTHVQISWPRPSSDLQHWQKMPTRSALRWRR